MSRVKVIRLPWYCYISVVSLLMLCHIWSNRVFSFDSHHRVNCSDLRMGQFRCNSSQINPETQQPLGCTVDNVAKISAGTILLWHWFLISRKGITFVYFDWTVSCELAPGLICEDTGSRNFEVEIPCKYTNGYTYSTALLLSVFLGFLGADRFYLGHIGMGALKFCTLGFLFVGHIIDIILIATQNIGPKDGSNFIVSYYGPAVESIRANNYSFVVKRPDW